MARDSTVNHRDAAWDAGTRSCCDEAQCSVPLRWRRRAVEGAQALAKRRRSIGLRCLLRRPTPMR
jgi:hypothetical protein